MSSIGIRDGKKAVPSDEQDDDEPAELINTESGFVHPLLIEGADGTIIKSAFFNKDGLLWLRIGKMEYKASIDDICDACDEVFLDALIYLDNPNEQDAATTVFGVRDRFREVANIANVIRQRGGIIFPGREIRNSIAVSVGLFALRTANRLGERYFPRLHRAFAYGQAAHGVAVSAGRRYPSAMSVLLGSIRVFTGVAVENPANVQDQADIDRARAQDEIIQQTVRVAVEAVGVQVIREGAQAAAAATADTIGVAVGRFMANRRASGLVGLGVRLGGVRRRR